jgi:orotidine-5'-phosphate decarboxylase
MLTVHAMGGPAMLKAAAESAMSFGLNRPKLVAVTTLTSLSQSDLASVGISRDLATQTLEVGKMAIAAGIDGLVCSPLEASLFRRELGPSPILVTPGIRPAGADMGDQKRVASPESAIRAGASFLVVGRPILDAANPRQAALDIIMEMQSCAMQHK